MRSILLFVILLTATVLYGQDIQYGEISKNFEVVGDTVVIDSVSIYPGELRVVDDQGKIVAEDRYNVDFSEAKLWFLEQGLFNGRMIRIIYRRLPESLTREYKVFDRSMIVEQATDQSQIYSSASGAERKENTLFDGLFTRGSLSRGVTVGNNQDAVVNSNFNLQIEGNLSEKVAIRASITDNEVPLQSGGFTQRLDDFDRVFIELEGQDWKIRAGDIDLINQRNYFTRFQKKISGVAIDGSLEHDVSDTEFFASGALVKGKYHRYQFTGIDANQGPYRILGPNDQEFVLIISGSERVYANGVLLRRGENFDYTIDYNTAEITFTSLYTVTSSLRFSVEYQLSERSYTRFLTYDGLRHKRDKFEIGASYYNESDSKNSPIDQDLSDEQKEILAEAGNDPDKMIAPSEVPAVYDENRILYVKNIVGNDTIFVYSNDPEAELYQVSFSFVGEGNGDYELATVLAAGRVYTYVPPVGVIRSGSYGPIKKLVAPEKLQILTLDARYQPVDNSSLSAELAFSDRDRNLFSSVDNELNKGYAAKLLWDHEWKKNQWSLNSHVNYELVSENFNTIERLRNIEFGRDWNLIGNEAYLEDQQQRGVVNLTSELDSLGHVGYTFESLFFGDEYSGFRHTISSQINKNGFNFSIDGSILGTDDTGKGSDFYRLYSDLYKEFDKAWVGGRFNFERNQAIDKITDEKDPLSHSFREFEGYGGIGDSTGVFTELGYNLRFTDSIRQNNLDQVQKAHTVFLKSRLVKKAQSDLYLFANYRAIENRDQDDEQALNARLSYRQGIWQRAVFLQTLIETQSGTLPQQEFTYVEVAPGKGYYEWIDFNGNGIQELDEFVVARFQDQAKYVRVLLPNIQYLKTTRYKWSQSLVLHPSGWQKETGIKKVLSKFVNQTFFLIDANHEKEGEGLSPPPIGGTEDKLLSSDQNLKNSLFFNRGIQKFSMVYTYLNARKKTLYVFGDQDLTTDSHQFQFLHKLGRFWLIDIETGITKSSSESDSYANRNYLLDQTSLRPKMSYLLNKNTRFELGYTFKDKKNETGIETLTMHVLSTDLRFAADQKFSSNASLNLYSNEFTGDSNSPVAYQMLEGLQPGMNLTWLVGIQKRITSFLDVNLSYQGRKSENTTAIHTGNVQVRASF